MDSLILQQMKVSRSSVIETAKTWLGTPWARNQATKDVSCDCVGFLSGVGREIGFLKESDVIKNYPSLAREDFLLQQLDKYLIRIPFLEKKPADILVFERMGLITHVGILIENDKFIHSTDLENRGVIENYLDHYERSIVQVYQIPGID